MMRQWKRWRAKAFGEKPQIYESPTHSNTSYINDIFWSTDCNSSLSVFFNIYTYKVRVPGLRHYLFLSTAGWIIHNAIEAYSYGGINSISARYDMVKKQHDSPFGVSWRCLRDIERLICGLLCSLLIISISRCIPNGIHLRYIQSHDTQ